jgi:threonine aldolase
MSPMTPTKIPGDGAPSAPNAPNEPSAPSLSEKDAVRARCSRFLSHHHPHRGRPHQALSEAAAAVPPGLDPDTYGEGELIESFEREVAGLLGKEAAVFMPSGTMAQQIALRIWADRTGRRSVAYHPTSHLEIHEERALEHLHGIHSVLVGSPHRLITTADLQRIREPIGSLLLELPQREIGGQLPSWDDLLEATAWARGAGARVHLDGARLWEIKRFYQRSYAEIAGLFDSVYVSFYKGLGGIAGCGLAGPLDFIQESRVWRRRYGGTLVHLFPYVIAARAAMAERLDKMDRYVDKAIAIGEHLARIDGIEIVPSPPQTNMMHVFLRGDKERLEAAALTIARERGIWLFKALSPSSLPAYWKFELTVGDAALDISEAEIASTFQALLESAKIA